MESDLYGGPHPLPMAAKKMRKLDRKALVMDGTPRAEAAKRRTASAIRTFRRMDGAMEDLRSSMEGWMTGKDMALRNGAALTEMAELMDRLWKDLSEADYFIGRHKDGYRPFSLRADETMRSSKVYPDEPAWKPSSEMCCPACGDFLMIGPEEGDMYCPYCRRLVSSCERRPMQKDGWARPK